MAAAPAAAAAVAVAPRNRGLGHGLPIRSAYIDCEYVFSLDTSQQEALQFIDSTIDESNPTDLLQLVRDVVHWCADWCWKQRDQQEVTEQMWEGIMDEETDIEPEEAKLSAHQLQRLTRIVRRCVRDNMGVRFFAAIVLERIALHSIKYATLQLEWRDGNGEPVGSVSLDWTCRQVNRIIARRMTSLLLPIIGKCPYVTPRRMLELLSAGRVCRSLVNLGDNVASRLARGSVFPINLVIENNLGELPTNDDTTGTTAEYAVHHILHIWNSQLDFLRVRVEEENAAALSRAVLRPAQGAGQPAQRMSDIARYVALFNAPAGTQLDAIRPVARTVMERARDAAAEAPPRDEEDDGEPAAQRRRLKGRTERQERTRKVFMGEEFSIDFVINASVGHGVDIVKYDPSLLAYIGENVAGANDAPGASASDRYSFKALREGETVVQFEENFRGARTPLTKRIRIVPAQ